MRIQILVLIGAIAIPSIVANNGCASSSGTGGSTSTGGSAGTGGSTCTALTPCGGDLVGTWTATTSCMTLSGLLDTTKLGTDCKTAPITGGTAQVTGSITFKSDNTFTDNTTTSITDHWTLLKACLSISGTVTDCTGMSDPVASIFGYTTNTCTPNASGGCDCTSILQGTTQKGGLGIVDLNALADGNYSISGNVVTTTDGRFNFPYQYCVSGNTLTLVPQVTMPTMAGTFTFQKQ
jgi:hypothetical protein